jgi:hypothetical protein
MIVASRSQNCRMRSWIHALLAAIATVSVARLRSIIWSAPRRHARQDFRRGNRVPVSICSEPGCARTRIWEYLGSTLESGMVRE